jgi:hypothetical protein
MISASVVPSDHDASDGDAHQAAGRLKLNDGL